MNKAVDNKIEQAKRTKPGGRSSNAANQTQAKKDKGNGAQKLKQNKK